MRANVKAVHGQHFIGADKGHGHYIHLGFDRQVEGPTHKWLQLAGLRSATFGEDDNGHARPEAFNCAANAVNGAAQILLVDRDLSRTTQMPAHEWIAEELFFSQYPELEGQVLIQHWNIQGREMVHGIDMRLTGINLFQPFDGYTRSDRGQNHPRP